MDKREFFCLLLAAFFTLGIKANAQGSASAYQRIELHIQPSIEIASLKQPEVQLTMKKGKTHSTGTEQEFRIRSNKNFVVKVSALKPEENEPAAGTATPGTKNDLRLSVLAEGAKENLQQYTTLTDSPKDIITKGRRGEQTFAVNYQMKHTSKHNAGNYAVGVVYTATEP